MAPEALRWTGRPPPGLRFERGDVLRVPLSLLWGGFAIFWEYLAFRGGAPLFFLLWGVPFVLVGIYIVAGRFFYNAYIRSRTYYGLTSDCALIVSERPGGGIERLYLPAIKSIRLTLRSDGSGTIAFGDPGSAPLRRWNWSRDETMPSFEAIPDARRVYELCSNAQRAT